MIEQKTVQQTTLTPEVLKEFQQAEPLPGERALKAVRLRKLLKLMRDGEFVQVTWARGRNRSDGKVYRFDGQHTAHLLGDLLTNPRDDMPFPKGLPVLITNYEFDSLEEDAARIFDLFNNPLSVRSNTDMMGVYKASFAELTQIDPAFLVKVTNGISYYHRQTETKAAKGDQAALFQYTDPRRAGALFSNKWHREFAVWAANLRDTKNARFLNRTGIMARLYADWRDDTDEATQFWTLVLTESHSDPDDETRLLADDLRRFDSARNKVTQEKFFREAAKAWKRYRRNLHAAA
jgi:hypothetical protein